VGLPLIGLRLQSMVDMDRLQSAGELLSELDEQMEQHA
jgi:hypothetical protein